MRSRLSALLFLPALLIASSTAAQTAAPENPTQAIAELACAPRPPHAEAPDAIRVLAGLEGPNRRLTATGDHIVVGAGTNRGLRTGDYFYVRRLTRPLFYAEERNSVLSTAGWVQIETVQTSTATARIVWACDGIEEYDFLEPFSMPVPVTGTAPMEYEGLYHRHDGSRLTPALADTDWPKFDATGVVLAGNDSRVTGAAGDRILVDPAGVGQLRPGETVTLFRRAFAWDAFASRNYPRAKTKEPEQGPLTAVGEGIVLEVSPTGAVVQVRRSSMEVRAGDRVAVRR